MLWGTQGVSGGAQASSVAVLGRAPPSKNLQRAMHVHQLNRTCPSPKPHALSLNKKSLNKKSLNKKSLNKKPEQK